VDGNVRRVLSRLYDVAAPTAASIRPLAAALVDETQPGLFNQALMELGATLCTPRAPRCESCPVQSQCSAFANGTVEIRPGKKPKKTIPHERVNVVIQACGSEVLLVKRPEKGLLAGLWSFPECDVVPENAMFLGEVTHTFSHKRITYVVHLIECGKSDVKSGHWLGLTALDDLALPVAQRRIERLLLATCAFAGEVS
jgi:A/G-specific adenine glycosylase